MLDIICAIFIPFAICAVYLKQMKLIKKLKLENASLRFLIEENKEKETI